MSAPMIALLATLSAAALSVLFCRLVIAARFMDAPDSDRKSQINQNITPSSGGLGVIAALVLALLFWARAVVDLDSALGVLGLGILALLLLGWADDMFGLRAKFKLFAQVLIAILLAFWGVRAEEIGLGFGRYRDFGLVLGIALSALWIVTVVNAVNFMDGANGMSMGLAMFAAFGMSAVAGFAGQSDLMIVLAVLGGALGGFLYWNIGGKLFVGDAGALSVGGILAGASLLLVQAEPDLAFVLPILLAPTLIDVLLTLAHRVRRGERFWEAHNEHVYQEVLKASLLPHWQVSAIYWILAVNCAVLAFAASLIGPEAALICFVFIFVVGAMAHRRLRTTAITLREEAEARAALEAAQDDSVAQPQPQTNPTG